MADRKDSKGTGRTPPRKKEKKAESKAEAKAEVAPEEVKGKEKEKAEEQPVPAEAKKAGEKAGEKAGGNGGAPAGAAATDENGEFQFQPLELPPFEVIEGDRIDPFAFKFQFKNVEYSSGRNKTFLCFLIDAQSQNGEVKRGYLEDEHAVSPHAEDAFFQQVLPACDPAQRCTVTWYVSSSPCPACAAKLVEVLKARKSLRLTIFCARIFMWEEPEARAALKSLGAAGCKLRMMKPTDFIYTWDTFVDHEDTKFEPWEDCMENYDYYVDKLIEILQ